MATETISLLDPSLIYRPTFIRGGIDRVDAKKDKALFRNYTIDKDDPIQERVRETYLKMHTYQTVDFVKRKLAQWTKFDQSQMGVMEALRKLNCLVDESDPDVDVPNIVHAFQTAERIREAYPSPDMDWLHLTGLVHDLGKVMAIIGGEQQWAVVGDTFPVGCAPADSIVYRDCSFGDNPDLRDPNYNVPNNLAAWDDCGGGLLCMTSRITATIHQSTKLGMYSVNCGLNKVLMSWGHDEYLYRVLVNHGSTLPLESLYMIRYHSFYPWHTENDYDYLCDDLDTKMLAWVRVFNKFDLYTKSDDVPDMEALTPYYQSLIDKYIPGIVRW